MALIRITAALVLVLALALHLSAAAPPDRCTHVCGHMRVPYPFGIGPPDAGCYLPGLNLTCDTSRRGAPRLLIGAGAGAVGLQVVDIFLHNSTLRVVQSGDVAIGANGRGLFNGDLRDHGPYKLLSSENELVVTGCNVMATLLDRNSSIVMSACASFCQDPNGPYVTDMDMGSCKEPVVGTRDEVAGYVQLTRFSQNATMDEERQRTQVFVAENGWFDRNLNTSLAGAELVEGAMSAVPLLLKWDVVDLERGRPPPNEFDKWFGGCPTDLARNICRSGNSTCYQSGGYSCSCNEGYDGNPYVNGTEGCHDIDECKREDTVCFGECTNTLGSFECRCPLGTSGNHSIPGGCVNLDHRHKGHSGLIIGLSIASLPTIILSALGTIFLNRKLQHHRAKQLKQKFFNQNRGQLLKQLVSHRADIAERMIIPLEELEKATNNFDQARKIGGGGHGIVYKGILSDLHVVAIKKSKIVVQREIDEFINEVAILSQINHRNVVKLYGCCLESEVPLLAYEFISNGTLSDLLHKKPPISILWEDRLRIATEIAKALAYLHTAVSIPVVHRDIKSSNILLDDAFTAKVSDFGASRHIPTDQTGISTAVQGTLGYLDPSYYYTGRLTEKSDVYSFGIILIELLTRKIPTSYKSSEGDGLAVQFIALFAEGKVAEILDPDVLEDGPREVEAVAALAASCITLRADERPTMRHVEMVLESLQAPKVRVPADLEEEEYSQKCMPGTCQSSGRSRNFKEASRRYSLEDEFVLSARYPR